MNIEIVKVGILQTNCYILSIDNDVLIIDPGDEYNKIISKVGNKNIIGVLITHSHFDHIGCLNYFNKDIIYDYNNLKEGMNSIGKFNFEVIYNPGHSIDSISYYFDNIKSLFCGDFIFYESIGRTDLEGGSTNDMINSIKNTKRYSDDIKIYPGHGDSTSFLHERKYNIYFKEYID